MGFRHFKANPARSRARNADAAEDTSRTDFSHGAGIPGTETPDNVTSSRSAMPSVSHGWNFIDYKYHVASCNGRISEDATAIIGTATPTRTGNSGDATASAPAARRKGQESPITTTTDGATYNCSVIPIAD